MSPAHAVTTFALAAIVILFAALALVLAVWDLSGRVARLAATEPLPFNSEEQ